MGPVEILYSDFYNILAVEEDLKASRVSSRSRLLQIRRDLTFRIVFREAKPEDLLGMTRLWVSKPHSVSTCYV
jgi:hypothetical protein